MVKLHWEGSAPATGFWLGYDGLRYGPDQGIAKSPGKPWKMARLEIYGRRKKLGELFFSLWQPLNCLGLIWIFSALFPGAAELSATEMAHSASPSSYPHSWQPAELGCRRTLLGCNTELNQDHCVICPDRAELRAGLDMNNIDDVVTYFRRYLTNEKKKSSMSN